MPAIVPLATTESTATASAPPQFTSAAAISHCCAMPSRRMALPNVLDCPALVSDVPHGLARGSPQTWPKPGQRGQDDCLEALGDGPCAGGADIRDARYCHRLGRRPVPRHALKPDGALAERRTKRRPGRPPRFPGGSSVETEGARLALRMRWTSTGAVRHAVGSAGSGGCGADVAMRVAVRQVLASLTERQRAVVVLRLFDDLPEAQVAQILGCAVGTVKATMSQALARLRNGRRWATRRERPWAGGKPFSRAWLR